MRIDRIILLSALAALLCSCREELPVRLPVPSEPGMVIEYEGVLMGVEPIRFEQSEDTKASLSADELTGLSFLWDEDDAAGVYSSVGGFARYDLTAGAGTAHAVFDGGGFSLEEGATYSAFFPYAMSAVDPSAIELSYAGQKAVCDGDTDSVMEKDYLWSSTVADGPGSAFFGFRHAGAFIRLRLSMPAGTAVDEVNIVPMYGEMPVRVNLNAADGALNIAESSIVFSLDCTGLSVPESGTLTLWAAVPAISFSSDSFALTVRSGSDLWSARHGGCAFGAGKAYRWDLSPVKEEGTTAYGFSSVTEKSAFSPASSSVPSGQYSGIAYIGGSRYAVVHDKLAGGGIVFFDIVLDENGAVTSVTAETAEGTGASSESGLDGEGIAYVPGTPGRLYVSSEATQSVREYDLDGYPTGAAFSVPSDMLSGKITSNNGFEALTYNDVRKRFWTITEAPLLKDATLGRVLRLQGFDSSFEPAERFLYRMDEPSKSSSESAAASSYVFGVPALAALDDGRVLVLEREVYVPNGSTLEKALNSFTKVRIYSVNPGTDPSGVLRKSLVCSFSTSALNLGNFEGMCVGPALADGSTVLVLVADSQGGSGGLTKEYVKTIIIK